jgi:hypothetical protein
MYVLSHFELPMVFGLHLNSLEKFCTSPVGALYYHTNLSPPWANSYELNMFDRQCVLSLHVDRVKIRGQDKCCFYIGICNHEKPHVETMTSFEQ